MSGCPLACGITLEKLTAHTVDEFGRRAFVSQNPMAILRKVPVTSCMRCELI